VSRIYWCGAFEWARFLTLGVGGSNSTLVTYTQLGHSYAINPGSRKVGSMRTTSFMVLPHRGHDMSRFVLERSDTSRPL
jgi:hypothetical protein